MDLFDSKEIVSIVKPSTPNRIGRVSSNLTTPKSGNKNDVNRMTKNKNSTSRYPLPVSSPYSSNKVNGFGNCGTPRGGGGNSGFNDIFSDDANNRVKNDKSFPDENVHFTGKGGDSDNNLCDVKFIESSNNDEFDNEYEFPFFDNSMQDDISDNLESINNNICKLNKINASLVNFNESFGSFLFGLSVNAWCVNFEERPTSVTWEKKFKLNKLNSEISSLQDKVSILEDEFTKLENNGVRGSGIATGSAGASRPGNSNKRLGFSLASNASRVQKPMKREQPIRSAGVLSSTNQSASRTGTSINSNSGSQTGSSRPSNGTLPPSSSSGSINHRHSRIPQFRNKRLR
ncbi:unnamed protein product [[Candida] boidinii]|uniref:DASH complex subunit DAM1 n=1 Tax=Candida boidinii TaxID=5477 RepID=A0A9W6T5A6_CANBO|nr:unnamed protein product [[Candida] boidinii]GMF98720.1 unnamed protein product [[Candida] boidinii]